MATTFHVTLDHLLHKDDFKLFEGDQKPVRFIFADLTTHVGMITADEQTPRHGIRVKSKNPNIVMLAMRVVLL